jgi:hypothetical protein
MTMPFPRVATEATARRQDCLDFGWPSRLQERVCWRGPAVTGTRTRPAPGVVYSHRAGSHKQDVRLSDFEAVLVDDRALADFLGVGLRLRSCAHCHHPGRGWRQRRAGRRRASNCVRGVRFHRCCDWDQRRWGGAQGDALWPASGLSNTKGSRPIEIFRQHIFGWPPRSMLGSSDQARSCT